MKIMTFRLSDGVYAVDLTAVSAVQRAERGIGPTAVPADPPLDLGERLGYEEGSRQGGPVLVLQADGRRGAVRVDEPGEVLDVNLGDLRPVPRFFDRALLRAVVEVDTRLVVLLDEAGLVREARAASASAPNVGED